jgi:predicted small lipoprotein YifL
MAVGFGGQVKVKLNRKMLCVALAVSLVACGQKGPLYLPEQTGEIVTRPTQTPVPGETPEAPPLPQAPSSPQTVDSPEGAASPAPEVVAPQPGVPEVDKKKQDAAKPR